MCLICHLIKVLQVQIFVRPHGWSCHEVILTGKLRLCGNHTVTEYEMSGELYSQNRGWINHSDEQIFQVMTFK